MDNYDPLRFSKDTILNEWEILWNRVLTHDKQIFTIRKWCIVTWTALLGFYLHENNRNDSLLFLIIVVTIIFALNDGVMQFWKLEVFQRLFEIEKPFKEMIESQVEDEETRSDNYRPKTLPDSVRKKLEKKTKLNWICLRIPLNFFIFYGAFLILPVLIYLCFTGNKNPTDPAYPQEWAIVANLVNITSIFVSVTIAIFILRQVKAAELANQKSVVPVLGITLKRDSKGEKLIDILVLYIRNNIALNIECEIFKNGELFYSNDWPSAIPSLGTDELLPIWEKPIKQDIPDSGKNKKVTFKAILTYESILKDKYRCIYSLSVWKDTNNQIKKEEKLESWEFPWNCSL